jgi:acyl-CoA thioesterase FadM
MICSFGHISKTTLKDHNKMKGVFSQEIVKRSTNTLVAKADVTWVFVDLEGRLQPIPQFFQDAFGF